jgi:hypothetical protein
VGFAVVGVRAVAFEAFVGENGADVEVKADLVNGVFGIVQAGRKDEDTCGDQGQYGSNATDGSRFTLKINYLFHFSLNGGTETVGGANCEFHLIAREAIPVLVILRSVYLSKMPVTW